MQSHRLHLQDVISEDFSFKAIVAAEDTGKIVFMSNKLKCLVKDETKKSIEYVQDILFCSDMERKRFLKILEISKSMEQKCQFDEMIHLHDRISIPVCACVAPLYDFDDDISHLLVLFEQKGIRFEGNAETPSILIILPEDVSYQEYSSNSCNPSGISGCQEVSGISR